MESALCAGDLKHFFRYVWIQDRNTGKKVKWQPWDYLLDLLDILLEYRIIDIIKARQLGVSWLLMGYATRVAIFNDAALGLTLSQGEKDAWKLLDKAKFIHRNLPDFLRRVESHPDSREMLDFKETDSRIEALPSTQKAGRGTDATFIIRDELAFHPYGSENFNAISPSVDAGGQLINLSTIDKWDTENHFTTRINQALEGAEKKVYPSGLELYTKPDSSRCLIFLGWRLRPVRQVGMTLDEWWDREIVPHYEAIDREGEYPRTLEEALSPPKITCRFDVEVLDAMLGLCHPPLRYERNGRVRIYREPQAGLRYVFVVDSSRSSEDPCAGILVDAKSCEKFMDFGGMMSVDEQASIVEEYYEKYYKPLIAIEVNEAGGALLVSNLMNRLPENKFYHYKKDSPGYWTSSKNRPIAIEDLSGAIRRRDIGEPSEDVIRQFRSFIRTEKKPDGAARKGTHDDFVTCWWIFWSVRKEVPSSEMRVTSFKYRG